MSLHEEDTTPTMQGTIRSGCFGLGYVIQGSGRPALVIGSSIYYPRTFSEALRKELKLVFIDHRGFAPHDGEVTRSDYDLDVLLADVELVRRQLGLEEVVVIGHSGHAYMALEYAKRYPRHVTHVVMIGAGPSQSANHAHMAEEQWREAVCPERKAKLEDDLRMLPDEIAAAPEKRFISVCVRLGAKSWFDPAFDATPLWDGVHVNMAMFDYVWGEVFRDIDITRGLDELDIPVLLALGRFDYLVAPSHAWDPYRTHFRHLTARVFDRSSHTPQFEESTLFDRELLAWLSTSSRTAKRPGADHPSARPG